MKRFLKFNEKDKQFVKMINQTDNSFELVIISDKLLKEFLEVVNTCEEQGDVISVVWQMKFKRNNYVLYKNCQFSTPMDNEFSRWGEKSKPYGKKLKVTCSGTSFYSYEQMYKNKQVLNSRGYFRKNQNGPVYKDGNLLERMLKISELNLISENLI